MDKETARDVRITAGSIEELTTSESSNMPDGMHISVMNRGFCILSYKMRTKHSEEEGSRPLHERQFL
jgi:hypothetical protein|tara:strand:+ start:5325 stop:5525 length:201 start_codon:yes stop_codon:yes gene_type:complete